jgi:molecular chaperone GrpE
MTDKELHAAFARHKIQMLHPTDEKFDPNFHQAIAEIPGTEKPHGTVVDVVQTGYVIEDRLLRPAMVTVAKGEHPAKQVDPDAAVSEEGDGE